MKPLAPTSLDKAVEQLAKAAPDATVILLGSHAREDSDVDLLVVEPQVTSRRREMVRLMDVRRPLRLPVNLVVLSRQVFEEWADTPGTVIDRATKEGKVLRTAA